MKRKTKFYVNMRIRFILLVMVELIGVTFGVWGIAKIVNIDYQTPDIVSLIILSFLLGGLINNFVYRRFVKPTMKLGKAMNQVADGDFSVRLESKKELREIQEIYANFNLMTEELGATEILQTDFVSNVSHEFKTPINAIEGYATLLQESEEFISREQEIYIEKILLNTRRLSNLVGNILLLSKVDNQAIQNKQSRYRLDEQIRQSIVMLEPEWSKKEIEFDADLEEVEYTGNESILYHVWQNLIGNAVKFSPQGGRICIRMIKEEDKIVFSVEDHGPGIPEGAEKHIFDRFYQGDSSHKEEGNGLGLALVKQILQIYGGSVSVENLPAGGCRFTVILR